MMGEPEDQAWLALYLVSDASRFVTGQVVRANGGWSMP
jgi:3-oxoacyl-[acyl-carrier protein] reductase